MQVATSAVHSTTVAAQALTCQSGTGPGATSCASSGKTRNSAIALLSWTAATTSRSKAPMGVLSADTSAMKVMERFYVDVMNRLHELEESVAQLNRLDGETPDDGMDVSKKDPHYN